MLHMNHTCARGRCIPNTLSTTTALTPSTRITVKQDMREAPVLPTIFDVDGSVSLSISAP